MLAELAFSLVWIIYGRARIDYCINGRIMRKRLPIFLSSKAYSDRQGLMADLHPLDAENLRAGEPEG
jgi:hypothetical protein